MNKGMKNFETKNNIFTDMKRLHEKIHIFKGFSEYI